jgi:UDP-glucose 4-epimerase
MAINIFTKAILEGNETKVYGDGEQTRDFTYVDDVVKANLLSAESKLNGEIFNIGGGNRISVSELIKNIENICGKTTNIINLDKQHGDVKNTLADTEKVKNLLKWSPTVKIQKGLKNYINWIKENNLF